MLTYIVLFTAIGAAIGWFIREPRTAFMTMVAIAVFWGLTNRVIWGFVTFGELMIGFGAVRYFVLKQKE